MIKLYPINTGSCGGCDVEIRAAVCASADMTWVDTPQEADALVLTGPLTAPSRPALLALLQETGNTPLLAIGRCAIDGFPFGKGGVKDMPQLKVRIQLEGCPPTTEEITEAIRKGVRRKLERREV
ncbi:MAG: NADH:ubiquinone oxidoreductase [Chloroflexaceae bacterium]|jgi:Ni,Fe-hydrogenase III small subunit|nr:NADH:ubiquinone oxidoreductase [Chloroflexaceae bacterium]